MVSVDSRWKKRLSFLVTVSMVLSLVPSPALAEAMEEMSGSNDSAVPDAVQSDGSQAQMTEQSEGQMTEQPQGQGAGSENPVGEALSTSGVGLTVQGDGDGQSNHEYTQLTLNESVNYSLANDETLWGSFTAPEAGLYDFTAHNTSMPPTLFRIYDSGETQLAEKWAYSAGYNGGTEAPAIITRNMNEGIKFSSVWVPMTQENRFMAR